MDSDEWGEGSGVGTYERGGSAARPSSSVWALVVCVGAHRLCGRLSSVWALVVLSMGVHYAWVAHRRCLREVRHRLWVGVISCWPWVVFLYVGHGRHWC